MRIFRFILLGATLAGAVVGFQNCSNDQITYAPSGAQQGLYGGTGSDGMRYLSYGSCGSAVGVSAEIDLVSGSATLVRQNCQALNTPSHITNFIYAIQDNAVLIWNNMIFDMQTQPSNQRITFNYCTGPTQSLQLGAATYIASANPNLDYGNVSLSDGTGTGALLLTSSSPGVFSFAPGQVSDMTLTIPSEQVTYAINGGSANSVSALTCYSQALPASTSSAPTTTSGTSVAPTCQSLSQTPNHNSFSVSWTAGAGNGGGGGCALQYQMKNGTWANVASPATVNCDAPSVNQTITLPGDGWLGGPWNGPVNVNLVRLSDSSVMCSLGALTCSSLPGSSTPTPAIDEDCDNQWDNTGVTPGTPSVGCYTSPSSLVPGESYTCSSSTCTQPEPNYVFQSVAWYMADGSTTTYENSTCTGMAVWMYFENSSPGETGTVPSDGQCSDGMPVISISAATPGTCYSNSASYSCEINTTMTNWASTSTCYYETPATLPSTLYY